MSRTRSVSTALAAFVLLAASSWYTSSAFQLNAAPQTSTDAPGVAVDTSGTELLHRAAISYPRTATGTQIDGTVVAQVKLDAAGNVADASIISGPDELRKPVLQSLLNWHFAHTAGGSTRQVSITFHATPEPAAAQVPVVRTAIAPAADAVTPTRVVKQIDINGLPESARQELAASLPVHIGDAVTPESTRAVATAAKRYDEHLTVQSMPQSATEQKISIAPAGAAFTPRATGGEASVGMSMAPIRIGGNVAQTKLLQQVRPAYPPTAKQARIQGVVRFEVVIDKDGTIKNIHLVSGPPILVQAAMEAVQQWVYQPTLLNGNPVEVATTIDIHFALSDEPSPAQ